MQLSNPVLHCQAGVCTTFSHGRILGKQEFKFGSFIKRGNCEVANLFVYVDHRENVLYIIIVEVSVGGRRDFHNLISQGCYNFLGHNMVVAKQKLYAQEYNKLGQKHIPQEILRDGHCFTGQVCQLRNKRVFSP